MKIFLSLFFLIIPSIVSADIEYRLEFFDRETISDPDSTEKGFEIDSIKTKTFQNETSLRNALETEKGKMADDSQLRLLIQRHNIPDGKGGFYNLPCIFEEWEKNTSGTLRKIRDNKGG